MDILVWFYSVHVIGGYFLFNYHMVWMERTPHKDIIAQISCTFGKNKIHNIVSEIGWKKWAVPYPTGCIICMCVCVDCKKIFVHRSNYILASFEESLSIIDYLVYLSFYILFFLGASEDPVILHTSMYVKHIYVHICGYG